MRTINNWETRKETWEEYHAAGCYGPRSVLVYRDRTGKHEVVINTGTLYDVDVFREGVSTYVLTTSRSMGCAGLEDFVDGEEYGSVFFEDYQIEIGDRFFDLTPINQAKYLQEWL